ncbi:flagellar protein FliS [Thiomicrospira sp. R3]|uniref:flagellar export chaperone FliS n=1 Tax=Thiomicrospira sp. R3 TaxID=3035472 RepID=UPI00259BD50E|nr:flagellar protein FliS [Thiomicrospira sp. R3]WFE69397.1 flagellar protein FliS [Thiomicrospira sp. R3]
MNAMLHTQAHAIEGALLQEYNRQPDVEKVLADNPRKTVLMLLQGAVDKAILARVCHDSHSLVEKGFHLGRITTIIDALRDRLYLSDQTPLAYDLEALYQYADQCIQDAVYEKATEQLDNAIEIMTELRDAWFEMLKASGELEQNQ